MTLKRNIVANYISQLYVALVGILILPLYIKHMGAEAYGLIGFYAMLQSWFALLDLGLTPTIGRETARLRAGATTPLQFRQLFRSLSMIFIFIAMSAGGGLFLAAEYLSVHWLRFGLLSKDEVLLAVQIIAVCVALRWLGGLYRGVISGAEKQIWLSSFNCLIATLRFIAVFFSMWVYGFNAAVFFVHQFFVAVIELFGLLLMGRKFLPRVDQIIGWSLKPASKSLIFSLSIAFTSSVWVMVTQTDKMILSGLLSLSEYGHFSLAVLVASGILVLNGPVSSAVMPRLASLHASNDREQLIQLYRNATRFVAVITGPASVTLALCSKPLLEIWTGDASLAAESFFILSLYALGNCFLVMAAFPYYLQYARGNMTYHLIGNVIALILLVPSLVLSAKYFGGVGAGYAWLTINMFFALIWVTYVHSRLEKGLHWVWLKKDWMSIFIPSSMAACAIWAIMSFEYGVVVTLLQISIIAFASLFVALVSSGFLNAFIRFIVKR
ncbi:oligosaccharide flippase family protein [Pseudomonas sp. NyZ480]|uniref:oligosaccharide flippase family protein n=1 Tax=Pseudomonas sp. NyZ480 TaxID=3035289 RepID=UPI002408FB58|nr:oligosaccharide flippase family protein [Pseudomonas sp. NyZ480]WEZ89952.1 oligosaccharide flippase family protein [Pseudomonas sp. NyZ480]